MILGEDSPWWILLAITVSPGFLAVVLTIGSVWTANRLGLVKSKTGLIQKALLMGAMFGPLCQWSLQRAVSYFTGMPTYYELIVIAPFITGLASIIVYQFILIPVAAKKSKRVYNLLQVKKGIEQEIEPEGEDLTERPR